MSKHSIDTLANAIADRIAERVVDGVVDRLKTWWTSGEDAWLDGVAERLAERWSERLEPEPAAAIDAPAEESFHQNGAHPETGTSLSGMTESP